MKCAHPAFQDVKFWDELGAYIGTCTTCKDTITLPSVPLTTAELLELRETLFEFGELHAERVHLDQIRDYLRQQQMPVEFSPSAIGVLIKLLDKTEPLVNFLNACQNLGSASFASIVRWNQQLSRTMARCHGLPGAREYTQ